MNINDVDVVSTANHAVILPVPLGTTYFVNPTAGSDDNEGDTETSAWRSFAPLASIKLLPGDRVKIAAGVHSETLRLRGDGSQADPIVVEFAPGRHEFPSAHLFRRGYFVSNSCDAPDHPLPIAIHLENSKHVRFQAPSGTDPNETTIVLAGPERSTYLVIERAEGIAFDGISFDLARPTVSEFRVAEAADDSAVLEVAEGCSYEIQNGEFAWTGDLGSGPLMAQEAIPGEGRCWRLGEWDPFAGGRAEDVGTSPAGRPLVRLTYGPGSPVLHAGHQYQFRFTDRDVASGLIERAKDIAFSNCNFFAFTGMAIVSQFTEGITLTNVKAKPAEGTLRTCSAWADFFHFSSCRGQIRVDDCVFSGCQDDPINIHGTHLRILRQTAIDQLLLAFMHPQTYGIEAFAAGDEVAVISHSTLREYADNPKRTVKSLAPNPADPSGHEWLLTLDGPVPFFGADDVIDNLSWYPDVTISGSLVEVDSCRGFLVTSRGKVVINDNYFLRCDMPALLVEDDAEGWFESGPIRDMLVTGNTFIGSGIQINPHVSDLDAGLPVHQNIRLIDNAFLETAGISVRGVAGLRIIHNRFDAEVPDIDVHPSCSNVTIRNGERPRSASS